MIRKEVCWDGAVRIAAGIAVVWVGVALADLLFVVPVLGPLLWLAAVVPSLLYGVYLGCRGLWLVVEGAVAEAVVAADDPAGGPSATDDST